MAKQAQADIVLFGHSHKYSVEAIQGILYINPGSAGPARFRLKRTAAILTLPNKVSFGCVNDCLKNELALNKHAKQWKFGCSQVWLEVLTCGEGVCRAVKHCHQ